MGYRTETSDSLDHSSVKLGDCPIASQILLRRSKPVNDFSRNLFEFFY